MQFASNGRIHCEVHLLCLRANFSDNKQMKQYLERYLFWNIIGGANHFLVACND